MTTTPQRRFTSGALTAVLAIALLAPAAAAIADEPPVEDPTTTVLDVADVGGDDGGPADGPASASAEPSPSVDAPLAPEEREIADAADAAAPAAAASASSALAAAAQLFAPTIAAGGTWTTTIEVEDMVFLSVGVLSTEVSGQLRTPAGTSVGLAPRANGSTVGTYLTATPQSGTVTISLRNDADADRTVQLGVSYRDSSVDLNMSTGIGTPTLRVEAIPAVDGVWRADAVAVARIVGADGSEQTATMDAVTSGSPQRVAHFTAVAPGAYLAFATVTIDGVEYSGLVTTHVAAAETTPPVVEYLTDPAASNSRGWFARPVTVTLAASDTGAGVWRIHSGLDGAPLSTRYSTSVTIPIGEGRHELRYSAEDYQGNVSGEQTRTINVDLTPPTVDIQGLPAEVELDEEVTVSYGCADALSDVFSCVGPIGSGELLDTSVAGVHEFTVAAIDRAGNLTRETRSYRVLSSDRTAPSLEVEMPEEPASGWHTGPVTLRFLAGDDESGVALIRWEHGTGSGVVVGSTTTSTGELELAATGAYTVVVWAEDAAGNRSEPVSRTVRIDVHAPVIELRSPEDPQGILPNGHYAQHERVAIDFDCTDRGSGLASCDATTPHGELLPTGTPGTHELRIVATDVAGNRTLRVLSYTVDATVAPTLRDPRLAQTGAEWTLPGILLVAVLLAAGTMLLATRRLGGR